MSETEPVGVPERETGESTEGTFEDPSAVADEQGEAAAGEGIQRREEVQLDVIFDILKNQRRRHVLRYLREHETTTLSDLAEHVAALENDKDVRELTSSERKRVYVGLYQCHLPRMSDAGVIEFDSDRGRIELRDTADQLDEYLDVDDGPARPWHLYQLGLAVAGGATYVGSALLLGATAVPSLLVVPALVLAVSACALAQRRALVEEDEE